jgi:hypothetical protein
MSPLFIMRAGRSYDGTITVGPPIFFCLLDLWSGRPRILPILGKALPSLNYNKNLNKSQLWLLGEALDFY